MPDFARPTTDVQPDSILRLPAVLARTGLSRTSIYRLMQTDHFPRARRLSLRAVGWNRSDIDRWLATRTDI